MSVKEDLRVRRTKKALSEAFMKLLSTKPFEEITVNELCDVAGIRRATFYKHYDDKFGFLTSYTRSLRDRFDNVIWKSEKPAHTKDYYVAYARRVVEFLSENSDAVDNLFKSNLLPPVMAIVVEQNYKDTCERLLASVDAGMKLSASVEVTASMCAGSVASAIYVWIKNGRKETADEMADQIGAVISTMIETA